MAGNLLCFGLGYTARAVARRLMEKKWRVIGTTRTEERAAQLREHGFEVVKFDQDAPVPADLLEQASHWLISIPPDSFGDPLMTAYGEELQERAASREWIGYLSSTSVYGDRNGQWIDEHAPPQPTTAHGRRRLAAERAWRKCAQAGAPLHVFRIAGIYGPGRNALVQLKKGTAKRISAPHHVFNRIHVDDLARVLLASIAKPNPGAVYNVADDLPESGERVVAHAARILKMEPPPLQSIELVDLSPMMQDFYAECKKVKNERIKYELGVRLNYPSYREGLEALAFPNKRR